MDLSIFQFPLSDIFASLLLAFVVATLLATIVKCFSSGSYLEPLASLYWAHHKAGAATEIVGLIHLKTSPEPQLIREIIVDRLLRIRKFSCKVETDSFGQLYWKDVDEFDEAYHFQVVKPSIIGKETFKLRDILVHVSTTYSTPLDDHKPLWTLSYFPSVGEGKNGIIVARFNHAIGDGIALVQVLLSLLDGGLAQVKHPGSQSKSKPRQRPPSLVHRGWLFAQGVVFGTVGALFPPDRPNSLRLKDVYARGPLAQGTEMRISDGTKEPSKRIAISDPISLQRLKSVKNQLHGTINDVCVTVLTLAVRNTLKDLGDAEALDLVGNFSVTFPVNTRTAPTSIDAQECKPYNSFGLGQFKLPVHLPSPRECALYCRENLDKLKYSPAPFVQSFLTTIMTAVLPISLQAQLSYRASAQSTVFFSNVPGPTETVKIANVEVDDLSFLLFSPLGIYCGVLSYNGNVSMCVTMDKELHVDPEMLCKNWIRAFEQLEQAMKEN